MAIFSVLMGSVGFNRARTDAARLANAYEEVLNAAKETNKDKSKLPHLKKRS